MPVTGLLTGARGFGMFAAGPASDFVLIQSTTVGSGGASSITFSNIPQDYRHLQLRGIARDSRNTFTNSPWTLLFNGNAATIGHELTGNGSTASSASNTGWVGQSTTSIAGANMFAASVVDILDYADTSKNTTVRGLTGWDQNGSGLIILTSALWASTNAITSLTLSPLAAPFLQFTSFSLYGIR